MDRPHQVFMHFQHYGGVWRVTFSLLPHQIARRAEVSEETMEELQHAINAWGRGSVTLALTDAQLRSLQ